MYRQELHPGRVFEAQTRDEPRTILPRKALLCSTCRIKITWKEASVEINGSHRHVFVNPAGLVFEVGCFCQAENLSGIGPVTSEFTWFPGCSWQTLICSNCHFQLGWSYQPRDKSMFFGLILERLVDD